MNTNNLTGNGAVHTPPIPKNISKVPGQDIISTGTNYLQTLHGQEGYNTGTTVTYVTSSPGSSKPGLIYTKMNQVMKDIGPIGKNQTNTMQGFKFRGIDDMLNALYPALTKHGVFMAPSLDNETHELREVVRSNGKAGVDKHVHLQMSYTFYAEDGSSVVIGPIPSEAINS